MNIDLSTWLTKTDASARLGVSERTLERMCDDGRGPDRKDRPRDGKKSEPVYNPRDVDNLAASKPRVMPPGSALLPSPGQPAIGENGDQVVTVSVLVQVLDQFAGAIAARLAPPPATPKWLTLVEASAHNGLSPAFLLRVVRAGRLSYLRDGRGQGTIKVLQSDIDTLNDVSELSIFARQLNQTTEEIREVLKVRSGKVGE